MQRRNLFKLGLGSFGLAMSASGIVQAQEPSTGKTNSFDFVVINSWARRPPVWQLPLKQGL